MTAPVPFMLIGTFISAMFGNFAAILSATFSYLADVSSFSSRTKRTILLECMVYSGSIFSNLIAGYLLQNHGFLPVFILLLCVYTLLVIYWFFLKESLVPRPISSEKRKELYNFRSVTSVFNVLSVKRYGRAQATIFILLGCFFCFICCK